MHNTGVTGEAGLGLELVPIHIYGCFILYTFVILFPVITMLVFISTKTFMRHDLPSSCLLYPNFRIYWILIKKK